MIKLIASDMDGTLLTPEGKIPEEFFDIFKKLKEKNIEFVVASGRPYKTLYKNFSKICDDISYISDNGAMVVEDGKITSLEIIDKNIVEKIANACSKIENICVIFCGVKNFYQLPCDLNTQKEIDKYYLNKTIVNSYDEIDDDIFKISICDMDDALTHSYPILHENLLEIEDKIKMVVAGKYWTDITNIDVNKGTAIAKIQKLKGISKEETMVFGDYFNDVEMLGQAYYSYVMEDALDEMKAHGNFIAKSNKENGVLQVIKSIL
ncbi:MULTISPECIES: Cof-type HAD-IIB family hydrolase [Clostridium]|uniref:Cof-type HAD-IIB family hydrolase n=1 Tax=Clostridium nitritogenes TaxID=83340 RepID=A0ABN1LKQ5_9CLOT|nr:HAD family hydrolase [Clostridium baratii]AQM61308.1 haloacid dehalogenase [Clostridium baratii]KJU70830.1 haloacid dehalogenase [Clostridium baratii]MBT9832793.1 Cof-type HAD-IIB family hydrolase [Clostridium baratii]MDY3208345.1 HAD family hydrolase [Clostridium baratii]STA99284.1 HAD hydrolase, IIB family [Clostridium baratii]